MKCLSEKRTKLYVLGEKRKNKTWKYIDEGLRFTEGFWTQIMSKERLLKRV